MRKERFRNIAIIAHVDYGKTTLMDELLKQSGTFDSHQEIEERIMTDSWEYTLRRHNITTTTIYPGWRVCADQKNGAVEVRLQIGSIPTLGVN